MEPVPVVINLSNLTSNGVVQLPSSPDGEAVGSVVIPPSLSSGANTTLSIIVTSSSNVTDQPLSSNILNITLVDDQGSPITQLDSPLIICLTPSNSTKKGESQCLSYFDEIKKKWECQDKCLTTTKGNQLCGQTDHLTNFALLLSGNSGGEDPCRSDSRNYVLSWISLGLVAGAVVIVAISVVIIEVLVRWKTYKRVHAKSKSIWMAGEGDSN